MTPIIIRVQLFSDFFAFAIFPFIFVRKELKLTGQEWEILINHERIHLQQQLEMLVIPFYLFYFYFLLVNRFWHCSDIDFAYREILFEQEAFANETNLTYLATRKPFAWLHLHGTRRLYY